MAMAWPASKPFGGHCIHVNFATPARHHLLNHHLTEARERMVTPVLHRRWAREYLARADRTQQTSRKRRYLRLAVSNTVCAHRLEAKTPIRSANGQEKNGSAMDWLTRKR
jgi:hypothetical protein